MLVLLILKSNTPFALRHNINDGQKLSYVQWSQKVSIKLALKSKHTKLLNLQLPVLKSC